VTHARFDELERLDPDPTADADGARSALVEGAYRRHWDEICRYVRRAFGAGPPEPEDVAQATFARFAAVDNPLAIDNPRAFLFRTAHNLAVDGRRKRGRGEAVLADPAVVEIEGFDFSPEDVLVTREELDRLNASLADLTPNQRDALLMHRLDDLSFAEIGRRLGVSQTTATRLVQRASLHCLRKMQRVRP
jgi:RNA polymerase sigma-70 factor (ECF subfamily)